MSRGECRPVSAALEAFLTVCHPAVTGATLGPVAQRVGRSAIRSGCLEIARLPMAHPVLERIPARTGVGEAHVGIGIHLHRQTVLGPGSAPDRMDHRLSLLERVHLTVIVLVV